MPSSQRSVVELERPRRRLGRILRTVLGCPLCDGRLHVVAYRVRAIRLACGCGVRISVNPDAVARVMLEHPELVHRQVGNGSFREVQAAGATIAAVSSFTPRDSVEERTRKRDAALEHARRLAAS